MGSSRQTRHNLDENKDVPSTAATSGASATPSSPVWYYFIFFFNVRGRQSSVGTEYATNSKRRRSTRCPVATDPRGHGGVQLRTRPPQVFKYGVPLGQERIQRVNGTATPPPKGGGSVTRKQNPGPPQYTHIQYTTANHTRHNRSMAYPPHRPRSRPWTTRTTPHPPRRRRRCRLPRCCRPSVLLRRACHSSSDVTVSGPVPIQMPCVRPRFPTSVDPLL